MDGGEEARNSHDLAAACTARLARARPHLRASLASHRSLRNAVKYLGAEVAAIPGVLALIVAYFSQLQSRVQTKRERTPRSAVLW